MQKIATIPDWVQPKELFISWPKDQPSSVGSALTPFYKRLIKEINNVPLRILINTNNTPTPFNQGHFVFSKINSGDIWLRDFMPIACNINNPHYCKFKYNPAYLTRKDEMIRILSDSLSSKLPNNFSNQNQTIENIILDGGNFISNGIGAAITTNRIIADNQCFSINEIKTLFKKQLGIKNLIIIPVEPDDITGHIDGMVRFINESTVVVGDYPVAYKIGKAFMSRIADTMIQHGFIVTRIMNDIPESAKRKFPSAVGNYINYLRVSNTLYLPIYKNKDALNKKAIQAYESFGLKVIPIFSDELAEYGGILNCITWHYY